MSAPLYYACTNCFHTEAFYQIHDRGIDLCPRCGKENMKELEVMNIPSPPTGTAMLCLVCAYYKPWGIFDSTSGITVCIECRDKARVPKPEESEVRG